MLRVSLLLFLCGAAYCVDLEEVFTWKELEFDWKTPADKENALKTKEYVPENNLPLGVDRWNDKLFVTVPRWKSGVAASLAYIPLNSTSKSPVLIPYPSWEANKIPPESPETPDDLKHPDDLIVSVFRVRVDACDRLWVMDTGLADVLGNPRQVAKPALVVFDLNTDQVLRRYELKTGDMKEDSFFANVAAILKNAYHISKEAILLHVTGLEWKSGVAASLAYIPLNSTSKSPVLIPYPSWEANKIPPETPGTPDDLKHPDDLIVSVFRVRVDACDRLWVMDTGLADVLGNPRQVAKPALVVFDLNTDQVLRRYELKTGDVKEDSFCANVAAILKNAYHISKEAITSLEWKSGVAASLAYIPLNSTSKSPVLIPYPSWEANKIPPETPGTPDDLKHPDDLIVSVFRVRVDACDRLWVMDTGLADVLGNPRQVAKPALVVFDLKTDQVLRRYELKTGDMKEDSFVANVAAILWKSGVASSLAYIPLNSTSKSPVLIPYPSWEANKIPPESPVKPDDLKHPDDLIVSVFRVRVDACDRLWVMDTGLADVLGNPRQVAKPALVVFDLKTDQVLRRYELKTGDMKEDSFFANVAAILKNTYHISKEAITSLEWKSGVASSLAYIPLNSTSKSPVLIPYPSWEANKIPPESPETPDDLKHPDDLIVSVFRVRVDACDRLWVMDTGLADVLGNPRQVAKPALVVFDLNTDQVLRRYELKTGDVKEDSFFANVAAILWKSGVASSLAYIPLNSTSKSPVLIPYPSWEANKIPPETPGTPDDLKHPDDLIVSVFRVRVDACDRLWVMDTGLADVLGNPRQVAKPALVVFDLNTDQVLRRYELRTGDMKEDSFFANVVVDTTKQTCDDAFAYIPDLGGYGIVVYSWKSNDSWRIQHHFFHFDPLAGDYNVGGVNFQWTDGVFGLALSSIQQDGYRTMFFHPLSSTKEFAVSTHILRNQTLATDPHTYYEYKIVGDRGALTQASASYLDEKTGVLFLTQVNKNGVACWNTQKPLTPENLGLVASDDQKLVFPNDLTIDREGQIWVLSDRMPVFIYRNLNPNEVNYRILKAKISDAIVNSPCA